MKAFLVIVRDFGVEMEAVYDAVCKEDAERAARDDYSVYLGCFPEDVEIIIVEEI